MSSTNPILSDRDVNSPIQNMSTGSQKESSKDGSAVNSLEYHRQMLQSRLNEEAGKPHYVSPSDNIMSPCTAKLSAYRNKHAIKGGKPQSLFAKHSGSKLGAAGLKDSAESRTSDDVFGSASGNTSNTDSKESSPGC